MDIQAELVDATNDAQIWGQQYNEEISDLLTVQQDIAKQISVQLRLRLSSAETEKLTQYYTQDHKAYQLYLKGRYYWNKRTPEGLKTAIVHFQQAVDRDPGYALAYTGLADCYLSGGGDLAPNEEMAKAKAAVLKALQIDNTLAEAHASLAYVKLVYDWDWSGAEEEFKRAIELNPRYATARLWYGQCLAATGRLDRAMIEARHAQEFEPLSRTTNWGVGWVLFCKRQYKEAIEQFHRTLELDPYFVRAHWWLGYAYEENSEYSAAVAQFLRATALSGASPEELKVLKEIYDSSGIEGYWRRELTQLEQQSKAGYVSAFAMAMVYTRLGDKDQALNWLQRAYEEHSTGLFWLKVNPVFDSLRSELKFEELLHRINPDF